MPVRLVSSLPYWKDILRLPSALYWKRISTIIARSARLPVGDILRESLAHENEALEAYYHLLKLAQGKSVVLEEYARGLIVEEELHADAIRKMLQQPCVTGK